MNKSELVMGIAGTFLQCCLFLQLLKIKSYTQFPIFFIYVGFSVISAVTAAATSRYRHIFFYVYWGSETVYVAIAFLALQEAFRSVFRNFYSLRWFKLSFPVIGILIVFGALFRAVLFRPANDKPLTVALISLEIAVGFLQFAVFCVFILLVRFFHMRWQQHAFGIVLGFGIAAAGSLVAFLLRSEFGKNLDQMVRIVTPLSYIIGVAVWLATFLREEPSGALKGDGTPFTPEQMIRELRRHTKVVKGILGR